MNIRKFATWLWGETNPGRMPGHLFFGARSMDYRTAQKADYAKQNYTVCPRFWYVDAVFVCCDCGNDFVFSADEQRFWYEDKQFWVDSLPKRCAKCRKAERTRLELRKRYDSMISDALSHSEAGAKKEVIEIVNQLEAGDEQLPDRMKENRATLYAQLAKATQ